MKRMRYTPALLVLWPLLAVAGMPKTVILPSNTGTVTFSHESHREAACTRCHHTSGSGPVKTGCHNCHGSEAKMAPVAQDVFHAQCIGCHEKLRNSGKPAGPVKLCSECHRKPK